MLEAERDSSGLVPVAVLFHWPQRDANSDVGFVAVAARSWVKRAVGVSFGRKMEEGHRD